MGKHLFSGRQFNRYVVDPIRKLDTPQKKGDAFERVIRAWLQLDPLYAARFDAVWLWRDWPERDGHDTGIDIVARERDGSGFCGIQAKYRDPASGRLDRFTK